VLLDLAAEFIARGHPVDLVLMSAAQDRPLVDLIPAGVRTVDLGCPRLWTSVPALTRYLKRTRPTAVIAAMPLANAVAAYARLASRVPCRLILTEHNARSLVFGESERRRHLALSPLVRFGYRFGDCIVAVSNGVADRLRRLPGVPADRIRVIYNPAYSARIESLARSPVPHDWLADRAVPVIVASGRLELQKDFETLLRAFALVLARRPARLMILGDGSQRTSLEALADRLGLRESVAFEGFVMNPWAYVARAHVFVLSSVHEGLGNVLVEAMACGTSVVSTDCPAGPEEILQGGRYGSLVPMRDPAALADAVIGAIDHPVAPDLLRERARFFSIDSAMAGYLDALEFG
jgi:glycosyltransferase involved in cell wall biosynthesis